MGVHYQYDDEREPNATWYLSLWFLLVVIALVVLVIVWFTVARGPRPEMQAEAPPPAAGTLRGQPVPSVVPAALIGPSAHAGDSVAPV